MAPIHNSCGKQLLYKQKTQVIQLLFLLAVPTATKPFNTCFLKIPPQDPLLHGFYQKAQQNYIYIKFYIPCVPGFDEAGVEAELRNGSEDGSRKFVLGFALHEMLRLSSDKLSKLGLLCLLVSRRSLPKKAS